MTKQHFELTAEIILQAAKAHRRTYMTAGDALDRIANAFARAYAGDNPRFDRIRFLKACGLDIIDKCE